MAQKMAEDLAFRLEELIMERGWPVGEILGSEPDLVERYRVSRSVFREAVRIVEHHGVARMRRGPHGGLVVTAPDPRSVQRPAMLYLDWADVPRTDLASVRSALELTCLDIIVDTLTPEGEERLRDVLAREAALARKGERLPYELHVLLGRLTGNAALALFVETLVGLTMSHTEKFPVERESVEEVQRIHVTIVDALLARDVETAKRVLAEHLAVSKFPPRGAAGEAGDVVGESLPAASTASPVVEESPLTAAAPLSPDPNRA